MSKNHLADENENLLTQSLPSVYNHANMHNIHASKKLGQNFLFDMNICRKITKYAGNLTDKIIVEIGPGTGGLSRAILENEPQKLFAVEKDKQFLPILSDIQEIYPNFHFLIADALKLELSSIVKQNNAEKIYIIANLPYNVGTHLITKFILEEAFLIDKLVIMLQEELVDRICSDMGTKTYGRLSILIQAICITKKLFVVSKNSFYPCPKISSAVISLEPFRFNNQNDADSKIIQNLQIITRDAFSQRRKTLKSSLKNYLYILKELNIPLDNRAEQLSVEDYLNIARLLA